MEANKFELTARVNYVNIEYKESGTIITRVLLSKKGKGENEYDTYPVNFFGKTAEEFAEAIKKGDTVNITGRISISKYTKDDKKIERLDLIGFEFIKVAYDEKEKKYVPVETTAQAPKTEAKATTVKEDKPW